MGLGYFYVFIIVTIIIKIKLLLGTKKSKMLINMMRKGDLGVPLSVLRVKLRMYISRYTGKTADMPLVIIRYLIM